MIFLILLCFLDVSLQEFAILQYLPSRWKLCSVGMTTEMLFIPLAEFSIGRTAVFSCAER